MPSICAIAARRRLLRSLPCLALSISACLAAIDWQGRVHARRPQLAVQEARLQQHRQIMAQLPALGTPAQALPTVLASVLDILHGGDARLGVKATMLSLTGHSSPPPGAPADAQSLRRLAVSLQVVPGLLGLRLHVRASYRSYRGLRQWLAAIEALPVCIEQVLIEQGQIQLQLMVLGA